ncbi:MAG: outer membrane lipoprotein-sorting protein [Chitinophagaceae bacterium]|jgi:hypothetical protein
MKTLKLAALFITAALSITSVKAQTADEIINKYVEAIGGTESWKKVNSLVQSGTMTVQGMNIDLTISTLNGKGTRQDIVAMGMNNYMIVTPTEGWRFFPIQGQQAPEAMTADDIKESQDGLDVTGALVEFKVKGHTADFLGKEDVDGTECFKIKLTQKGGKVETYFIDAKTYLLLKTVSIMKANGQEAEVFTTFSNYQKLPEGISMPMSMSMPLAPGMNVDLVINKVEINKPIDESIFKVAK